MKLRRALVLLLAVLAGAAIAQPPKFVIESMDVDVSLQPNETLLVTEDIRVQYLEAQRGIIREIPYLGEDGRGGQRFTPITLLGVDNGAGVEHPIKVTREGRNLRIRIGDERVLQPVGSQLRYRIRYRISEIINRYPGNSTWGQTAEIYWNATGNFWAAPILKSRCTIRFPRVPEQKDVQAFAVQGPYGTTNGLRWEAAGQAKQGFGLQGNLGTESFEVVTTEVLAPGSGATLIVTLPDSLVPHPSFTERIKRFLLRYPGGYLVGASLIIGLLIWLLWGQTWSRPVQVQFEPELGLGPAESGALIDNNVDPRDLASIIFNLAVHGCVRIGTRHPHGIHGPTESYLTITGKASNGNLTMTERYVLGLLGQPGDTYEISELADVLGPHVHAIAGDVRMSLKRRGYYRVLPIDHAATFVIGGLMVFAVPTYFLWLNALNLDAVYSVIVGYLISFGVLAIFSRFIARRTRKGAIARANVLGLYEAMRRREHYLQWFSEKNLDQAKYEHLLPYAVAFGLLPEWNRIAGRVLEDVPSWYESDWESFQPDFVMRDLNLTLSGLVSEALQPMRADSNSSWWDSYSSGDGGSGSAWGGGSFGGGFSGGGFGGGGGSSW